MRQARKLMSSVVVALLAGASGVLLLGCGARSLEDGLLSPDREVRWKACGELTRSGEVSSELIPVLARSWKQYDDFPMEFPPPQWSAARKAGQEAVPALVELMREPDFRRFGASLLNRLGPGAKGALPELMEFCSSDDRDLCISAARVIASIGEAAAEAVPMFAGWLDSGDERLIEAALDALLEMEATAGLDSEKLARMALKDPMLGWRIGPVLRAMGDRARPAASIIGEALRAEDARIRHQVLYLISDLRGLSKPYLPDILALTDDPDERTRGLAVGALISSGVKTEEVMRVLARALLDPEDTEIRSRVASALADMKRPPVEALPELIETMETYDPVEATGYSHQIEARRWAAKAVGRMGPQAREAIPALVALLDDKSVYVRVFAAEALGRMGSAATGAVPTLKAKMKDDWTGKIYQEAIERITAAEDADVQQKE